MKIKALIEVLRGWDPQLKVVDKNDEPVRGARIVVDEDGAKVKLG